MGQTVGSLVVKLSAHIAEFTSGLQTAGAQARGFANNMSSSFGSGSLVVGNFGVAATGGLKNVSSGIIMAEAVVASSVGRMSSRLAHLKNAFDAVGRASIGRLGFGAMSNVGEAAGLGGGAVAGVAAAVVVTAAMVKLGNAIKADKEEAEKLGIAYDEFKLKAGEIAISVTAQKGAEDFADAWNTVWKWTKFTGQNLVGIAARLSQITNSPFFSLAAGLNRLLPEIPDDKGLTEKSAQLVASVRKQEQERKDEITKRAQTAKDANAAAGFHEAFLRITDPVADALAESLKKATEEGSEWFNRLAEAGKRLAETPLDRFAANLDALYAALKAKLITQPQFDAARGKQREVTKAELGKELRQPTGAASALMGGSRELANAIADASVRGRSRELEVAERTMRATEKMAAEKHKETAIPQ